MKQFITLVLVTIFMVQGHSSVKVIFKKEIQVNQSLSLQIGNYLEWETLSENDVKGFEVEHSKDGIIFKTLSKLISSKGHFQGNTYAFMDMNAKKGNNFYRLKIVGTNGDFYYSSIHKQSRLQDNDIIIRHISSVEVKEVLEIEYECLKDLEFIYTLTDIKGHLLISDLIIAEKGINSFVIPMENKNKGNYVINFLNGQEKDSVVFMKI